MKAIIGIAAALVILIAVAVLPLPIRPYLDFQVIYHADLGLLQGIPVYDHAGQVAMIARLANVTPEQVFVIPFPYPPWYALATAWLALLPINVAARLWFGMNLIMLGLSLWLLTDGLPRIRRAVLAVAAMLFPAVLGSLFVGQYIFPLLLGAALLTQALKGRSPVLVAIAAALLTFKPHLGILVLAIAGIYHWTHKEEIGRRALPWLAGTAGGLFIIGFAASPTWPIDYFHSLTGFESVSKCGQCTNLPMLLASAVGGGFGYAVIIAGVLLVLAAAWLARSWPRLSTRPALLVGAGVLITLLVSPYLQNYDYVLMLVPALALAFEARWLDWLLMSLAYLAPVIGLAAFGTEGNPSLVIGALLLAIPMLRATAVTQST